MHLQSPPTRSCNNYTHPKFTLKWLCLYCLSRQWDGECPLDFGFVVENVCSSCTSESKNNIDIVSCIIDYNLWLHYGMTWFIH